LLTGAIDERTVEPATETDDHQTVLSEPDPIGRVIIVIVPPSGCRRG